MPVKRVLPAVGIALAAALACMGSAQAQSVPTIFQASQQEQKPTPDISTEDLLTSDRDPSARSSSRGPASRDPHAVVA